MKTILIAAITMFGLATAVPAFAATTGGAQQRDQTSRGSHAELQANQDQQFAKAEARGQENLG